MPYFTLPDKTKLYFEIYGSELDISTSRTRTKPSIIVLHGGPDADHTFHIPFFKRLANDAQIVFYDHRGCGRSGGNDPARWNLKQWAKDLHAFCQMLNMKHTYIAGISFGGWVAMQYAVSYPQENYAGLILLDTEAFFDLENKITEYKKLSNNPEIAEVIFNYYKKPSRKNNTAFSNLCVPLFTRSPFPSELSKHCLVRNNMDSHFKTKVAPTYNLLKNLPDVTKPILYINGTINPHHSSSNAKQTASAFINAKVDLHLLKDIGFSTIDNPEIVSEIIRKFIQNDSKQL